MDTKKKFQCEKMNDTNWLLNCNFLEFEETFKRGYGYHAYVSNDTEDLKNRVLEMTCLANFIFNEDCKKVIDKNAKGVVDFEFKMHKITSFRKELVFVLGVKQFEFNDLSEAINFKIEIEDVW